MRTKHLIEGLKLLALVGAISLVLWTRPASQQRSARADSSGSIPSRVAGSAADEATGSH